MGDGDADGFGVFPGAGGGVGFGGWAKTLTFIPGRSGTSYTPETSGGAGTSGAEGAEGAMGTEGALGAIGFSIAKDNFEVNMNIKIRPLIIKNLFIKLLYHLEEGVASSNAISLSISANSPSGSVTSILSSSVPSTLKSCSGCLSTLSLEVSVDFGIV